MVLLRSGREGKRVVTGQGLALALSDCKHRYSLCTFLLVGTQPLPCLLHLVTLGLWMNYDVSRATLGRVQH